MSSAWSCYGCDESGTGEAGAVDKAAEKHTRASGHPTATYTPAPKETR